MRGVARDRAGAAVVRAERAHRTVLPRGDERRGEALEATDGFAAFCCETRREI